MARSRYIIGIDLGTTNSAVAYVDTKGRERPNADIRAFPVSQLVAPGETAPRPTLPSFLYLPGQHELPPGAAATPWSTEADRIVGEFARVQGAKVPAHLVSSAKSWLSHAGVDREAEILPWGAPTEARKVSPVAASADYLRHVREAWDATFAVDDPEARFDRQEVVLTVPASFDEAARELTLLAAKQAGYPGPTLLEEPQAAFYCWIVTHQDVWQREVRGGELILVCDIGGGTTDFSLITVVESPAGPTFRRVAVGEHLMLGGDNIDLALAHRVEAKLGGAKLDHEQWSALRYACRVAKEKLLDADGPDRWPVTIAGRGSRIIGGGLQSELTRAEVAEVALDGFFPASAATDGPARGARLGLQEFGLPFVADPAIPKHLAAFLRRHKADALGNSGTPDDGLPARPDAILFNGGALAPEAVRRRLVETIGSWFSGEAGVPFRPRVLTNASLDLAVAHGAAYYGVVRRGGGIRIGGGTARSYYVGVEATDPARPWLCVVPRDAEEGDEFALDRAFDLLTDRPVAFPLASSSVRPGDRPGDLVAADPDSILVLPPLETHIRVGRKAKAEHVAVGLAARVSEVGTIEVWCKAKADDRRWRLQIQLRAPSGPAASGPKLPITDAGVASVVLEQAEIDLASRAIREAFAARSDAGPARLVKELETTLDAPRDLWPPSALRALWDPLRDLAETRAYTPRHESRWFNLAGHLLRPGTGFPMDATRIKALWPTFHKGVAHPKDLQCWAEWWILWRRVAAGLNKAHHEEIYRRVAPLVAPSKGGAPRKGRPKPEPHELAEIWRCAASLERISVAGKETLGDLLVAETSRPQVPAYALWSLGRIGARVPLYGPANTVPTREKAASWARRLLDRPFAPGREATDAAFALAQLGRVSGDRARDLDDDLRRAILHRLAALGADDALIRPVRELTEPDSSTPTEALGDSLPVGLRLRPDEEKSSADDADSSR